MANVPSNNSFSDRLPQTENHHLRQHWSERNEGVHLLARTGNRETFTWHFVENVPSNDSFSDSIRLP